MIKDEQLAAYKEMAKNASANGMEEDYWKYPKSIKKAHDKVMKQYRLILEAEDMKPTAEAQTVLEKWLKDFGKDAVKAMKKVA